MEMLHPNPRQPGRGGPCHRVAAPVPLHADRGDGRTYIAADRRRSGETSTHGGLTNGHLKRHLNLHLLDGRDPIPCHHLRPVRRYPHLWISARGPRAEWDFNPPDTSAVRHTLRAAPPLRPASVLSPSRLEPLAACPFTPTA